MPLNIQQPSVPDNTKAKAPFGGGSSTQPFTVRVDPPVPTQLVPLATAFVAHLKACALGAVLSPDGAGLDSISALFRQRFLLNKPAVQAVARTNASRLVGLPVDQQKAELLQYAGTNILAPGALANLQIPGDVITATTRYASGVRLASLPQPAAGAGGVATASQSLSASIGLDFLLDVVRCDVDTNDPSRDRILLGGTLIDADGTSKKLEGSMIGEFDRGQSQTFNRVLTSFDVPTSAGFYPRTYSVLLVMAEEDFGAYPDWLTKITDEIQKKLKEWAEKAIKDAFGSGEIWSMIGAAVAWIASWAIGQIFQWIKGLYEDDHIQSHVFALTLKEPIVSFGNGMSMQYQDTIFAGDGGQYTVTTAWHLRADGEVSTFRVGPLEILKIVKESTMSEAPSVSIDIPAGYKLLGGGGRVNWVSSGQLLTACYPSSPTTWVVASKSHIAAEACTVTAFAFAARKADGTPIAETDYALVKVDSDKAAHPAATAAAPDGFTLVGGGARVNWDIVPKARISGTTPPDPDPNKPPAAPPGPAGNLLTASYPMNNAWFAASKDHVIADACTISAYAIALRTSALAGLPIQVVSATTPSATSWPAALVSAPNGTWILGGGAKTNYSEPGSLLTSLYPESAYWIAASKDHLQASPATVTAYAIVAAGADAPRMPGVVGTHVEEKSAFADNGFSGNDVSQEWRIYPGLPRPQGNYKLQYEESISLQRNLSSHEVITEPSGNADHVLVRVTVHGEGWWGTTGRFRAAYRVWWQQT